MPGCLPIVLSVLAADGDWKPESAPDGVTLESRPVEGSAFYEYRARGLTDASVSSSCDAVFEWGSVGKDHAHLKARQLLEDGSDSRLVYDQIEPPVVSSRDFAFRVTREHLADGSCRVEFHASNEKAPKAPDGWVRIEKLKGSWTFTPLEEKKTRVSYQLWAEPAGAIPALFVHGSQREQAVAVLKKGISKTREPQKK